MNYNMMQKFLIPTISLVFYYGLINWSLKFRTAQFRIFQKVSLGLLKCYKGRWWQQKENRANIGGIKNSSNTCSLSHFLKGKFLKTKFHTHIKQLDRKSKWTKPSGKPRYRQSDNIKMVLTQTGYENVDGFIWLMIWNSGWIL